MKRIGLTLMALLIVAFPLISQAPYVSIPDTAFLHALIDHGIDTDGDGLISRAEAEIVTNLDVSKEPMGCGTQAGPCPVPVSTGNICSLTGIEHFTNLDSLNCSGNHIDNIDLSENTNLKFLNCRDMGAHWGGGLRELNIQKCESLTFLDCSWTQLNFLDISRNTNLQKIVLEGYRYGGWGTPEEIALNVWDTFNEDSIEIDSIVELYYCYDTICFTNSITSSIKFTGSKAPQIYIEEEIFYSDNIELSCSETGKIYLVQNGTRATSIEIRKACIDSIEVRKNENTVLSLSSIGFGTYCLYAVSEKHIVSSPKEFSYFGVGVNKKTISDLRLFPNPTNAYLTIEAGNSDPLSIEITSLNGQQMLFVEMKGTLHQIDLSSIQKGVYLITIRSENFVTSKKIIKL